MKTMLKLALVAAAAVAAFGAHAQDFPAKDKTVTIVVPFAAGGPTDRVARDLAEALRKPLGATVVVDNTAGAGSSIGAARVARANPDGYTLLLNHIGMSTMPALYRKLSFSVPNDFEYLGMVNEVPMTLIARPTMPANNFKELTAWIQQNKGKINLGNAGQGSASHQTTNTTSQIEGKKVKAYAVTTAKRLTTPALKDLPTLAESGLKDFNVSIWHGLYAPKGTPADVQKKINDALKVALKDPEFIKKQEALGAVVITDKRIEGPEHKKFVAAEIDKWGAVIKAAGTYAD